MKRTLTIFAKKFSKNFFSSFFTEKSVRKSWKRSLRHVTRWALSTGAKIFTIQSNMTISIKHRQTDRLTDGRTDGQTFMNCYFYIEAISSFTFCIIPKIFDIETLFYWTLLKIMSIFMKTIKPILCEIDCILLILFVSKKQNEEKAKEKKRNFKFEK